MLRIERNFFGNLWEKFFWPPTPPPIFFGPATRRRRPKLTGARPPTPWRRRTALLVFTILAKFRLHSTYRWKLIVRPFGLRPGVAPSEPLVTPLSPLEADLNYFSFIHSGYFYRASSNPLLLRSVPDLSRILCRSFKRHRLLRVKNLSKVLAWLSWIRTRDPSDERRRVYQWATKPRLLSILCMAIGHSNMPIHPKISECFSHSHN